MISKISIIGGDLRIAKLAEMLIDEGVEVFTYGLEEYEASEINKCATIEEAVSKTDVILSAIPFTSNGETINAPFCKNKILISELLALLKRKNVNSRSIKVGSIKTIRRK